MYLSCSLRSSSSGHFSAHPLGQPTGNNNIVDIVSPTFLAPQTQASLVPLAPFPRLLGPVWLMHLPPKQFTRTHKTTDETTNHVYSTPQPLDDDDDDDDDDDGEETGWWWWRRKQ